MTGSQLCSCAGGICEHLEAMRCRKKRAALGAVAWRWQATARREFDDGSWDAVSINYPTDVSGHEVLERLLKIMDPVMECRVVITIDSVEVPDHG